MRVRHKRTEASGKAERLQAEGGYLVTWDNGDIEAFSDGREVAENLEFIKG